tara:strand:- start:1028 stop:1279 length:252 start_codon:yes stop_codon:yes gene_type:complete
MFLTSKELSEPVLQSFKSNADAEIANEFLLGHDLAHPVATTPFSSSRGMLKKFLPRMRFFTYLFILFIELFIFLIFHKTTRTL